MDLWATLVDAAVQALVLVLAAVAALSFERRARYRREIEETLLELNADWGLAMVALSVGPERAPDWSARIAATHESLVEVEVKARGYVGRKRRQVSQVARELRNGVFAAASHLTVSRQPVPPAMINALAERRRELDRLVLQHDSVTQTDEYERWLEMVADD